MARPFRRKGERFVAKLDPVERGVVVGLMEQVLELLEPVEPEPSVVRGGGLGGGLVDGSADESGDRSGDDEFDAIVSGLGGLGMGVAVAEEDQQSGGSSGEPGLRRAEGARDPALGRLLPDANREDPDASAEFRRLTEHGLRTRKSDNLRVAITALRRAEGPGRGTENKVTLDAPQAMATVVALTDVRLVLGERLGLRTDEDADRIAESLRGADGDDPAVYAMAVYDFLTWLQEGLAHALMP